MFLFFSWWSVISYLSWSLLGVAEKFDMTSADPPSVAFARVLYAVFLIVGAILLINMLIALLSNTYQRVEVSNYIYHFLWLFISNV